MPYSCSCMRSPQLLVRLPDRIEIEVIPPLLHEEQEVLPCWCKPVLHTRGHMVGLLPDDSIAQNPATLDHGQRESLGNQAERLVTDYLFR